MGLVCGLAIWIWAVEKCCGKVGKEWGFAVGWGCGKVEGDVWGGSGVRYGGFEVDFGALIFQSVSKKTTHGSVKKCRFHLWFFPPPIEQKIHIFRGFLANLESAIMMTQQATRTTTGNKL